MTEPEVIIIEADDSAVRHDCGTYVTPNFTEAGFQFWCPTCKEAV